MAMCVCVITTSLGFEFIRINLCIRNISSLVIAL